MNTEDWRSQRTAPEKPAKGSHVLEREAKRNRLVALEDAAKKAAKIRDGYKCRWPSEHVCRGDLEGAHIFEDKKMGGDHGRLSKSSWLLTVCAWIHRRGPESIHGKDLRVTADTPKGADGPCSFWKKEKGAHRFTLVAREVRIGQLERD